MKNSDRLQVAGLSLVIIGFGVAGCSHMSPYGYGGGFGGSEGGFFHNLLYALIGAIPGALIGAFFSDRAKPFRRYLGYGLLGLCVLVA
jgi:hypothetical protein